MFLGRRFVNPRLIGTYVVAGLLLVAMAELTFGLSSRIIELVGRNPTLSGRTDIWKAVLSVHINPIFGTGYQSFWLGDRLREIWEKYWFHPIEAHSGYIETYLSLGLLGLAILIGALVATFFKIRRDLLYDFEVGRLRLGYLAAIVAYNGTEAAFQGLSFLFFVFWVIALNYPNRQFAAVEQSSEVTGAEEEMELVYRRFGEG
jgi:O-antigen ligase